MSQNKTPQLAQPLPLHDKNAANNASTAVVQPSSIAITMSSGRTMAEEMNDMCIELGKALDTLSAHRKWPPDKKVVIESGFQVALTPIIRITVESK